MIDEKRVRDLLNTLCVELGFCLPPNEIVTLQADPPCEVATFTNAVFCAEGMDPASADRHLYRQVRNIVSYAFHEAENDGV